MVELIQKVITRSRVTSPIQVPPPDPTSPTGLSFLFSAGMVDPRAGKSLKSDRLPIMLIQGWAAQSQLYWDLGIRFHPDLAIKHLKGGGQFQVADIVDGPPPPPDAPMTPEEAAEKILDIVAEKDPQFAESIRRMRGQGDSAEKAAMLAKLQQTMGSLSKDAE